LWFKLHRGLQASGWFLQICGFVVSFWINQANKRHTPHAALGILVFVLGTQQPLNALFRCVFGRCWRSLRRAMCAT
jgi:hypothetical protein